MRGVEWAFAGCQRGKRSVALDLKSPDSRPALEALVEWADIVHHNLRMPAVRKLDLEDETLRALNPDLVYCHTSSYGPKGARAEWPGYDQLFQSSCGWEVAGAGEGNPPMWHRFGFMDHLCAISSLVATLLALYHRDRTGEGMFVAGLAARRGRDDVQRDVTSTPAASSSACPCSTGSRSAPRPGTRSSSSPTAGSRSRRRPTSNVRRSRRSRATSLDGAAEALRDRTVADALRALGEAGVPAEEVRLDQKQAFFDDPGNRAAGLVASYPHREYGKLEQPGTSWYFGDLDTRFDYAPPVLGEHTVEILTDLGLSPDRHPVPPRLQHRPRLLTPRSCVPGTRGARTDGVRTLVSHARDAMQA